MEHQTGEPPRESDQTARVMGRINRRVERTLANPDLTPEQRQEVFTLANVTALALDKGNPYAIPFAKELIEYTDLLMVPEETTKA